MTDDAFEPFRKIFEAPLPAGDVARIADALAGPDGARLAGGAAELLHRFSVLLEITRTVSGTTSLDELLPRLIDVTLGPDAGLDTRALAHRLAAAVPGASLDDHAVWLDRLLSLIGAIEAVAMVALALIGLAGITIVVFTTRSGLAIHEDVISVLHMIGARESYIARQFQAHVLGLALKGGVCGFAVAAASFAALGAMTAGAAGAAMPEFALSPRQWAVLGALPLVAAAVGTATARITVMRVIGRMT